MKLANLLPACVASVFLASCATAYAPAGLTGGFGEEQLKPDVWRVTFAANGYTTTETAQTYWLYRCAELTLAHGYAGFEIISPINLTKNEHPADSGFILTHGGGGGGGSRTVVVTGYYSGVQAPKPLFQATIQMKPTPFTAAPPHSFDAAALRLALQPYVTGKTCNGNVCPHVHGYLYKVPVGQGAS